MVFVMVQLGIGPTTSQFHCGDSTTGPMSRLQEEIHKQCCGESARIVALISHKVPREMHDF